MRTSNAGSFHGDKQYLTNAGSFQGELTNATPEIFQKPMDLRALSEIIAFKAAAFQKLLKEIPLTEDGDHGGNMVLVPEVAAGAFRRRLVNATTRFHSVGESIALVPGCSFEVAISKHVQAPPGLSPRIFEVNNVHHTTGSVFRCSEFESLPHGFQNTLMCSKKINAN